MNAHCFSFTSDISKHCDEDNNSFHFIHHCITWANFFNFSFLKIKTDILACWYLITLVVSVGSCQIPSKSQILKYLRDSHKFDIAIVKAQYDDTSIAITARYRSLTFGSVKKFHLGDIFKN